MGFDAIDRQFRKEAVRLECIHCASTDDVRSIPAIREYANVGDGLPILVQGVNEQCSLPMCSDCHALAVWQASKLPACYRATFCFTVPINVDGDNTLAEGLPPARTHHIYIDRLL